MSLDQLLLGAKSMGDFTHKIKLLFKIDKDADEDLKKAVEEFKQEVAESRRLQKQLDDIRKSNAPRNS